MKGYTLQVSAVVELIKYSTKLFQSNNPIDRLVLGKKSVSLKLQKMKLQFWQKQQRNHPVVLRLDSVMTPMLQMAVVTVMILKLIQRNFCLLYVDSLILILNRNIFFIWYQPIAFKLTLGYWTVVGYWNTTRIVIVFKMFKSCPNTM